MNAPIRVLIVDDDQDIRNSLSRQLTAFGHACVTAADGRAALSATAKSNFDVAFVDFQMPGMDGLELLAALRENDSSPVTIMLSGVGNIARAVDAMRLGAFDFLEKPIAPALLEQATQRAARRRETLRRSQKMAGLGEQWESTFDAAPDLIVVLDNANRILRCNQAMAARCGVPKESLIGRFCHEVMDGEELQETPCSFTGRPSGPEEFPRECAKGGRIYELTSAPLVDRSGKPWGSMRIARDITDRKRAEQALRDAHAETERLLASISSILIGVDARGRVTRWNSAAESAFGIPTAKAIGAPFLGCPIPWDWETVRKQIQMCLRKDQPTRLEEIAHVRPDGQEGILGLTISAISRSPGERAGFLLLGADISERKFLQAQLAHAQKLEAIGQLAAGIAHEINTPTQYVGDNTRFLQDSFTDLLLVLKQYEDLLAAAKGRNINVETIGRVEETLRKADLPYLIEEIPKAIEQSLEGIGRVAKIVRSMKEFSHPGGEEKSDVDINRAIENTVTVSRNEWKYVAEVEMDLDPGLPPVPCLPGEFNQVILNLIVNAAHAIGDVVGDGASDKGKIRISARQDGDWAEIRVSDTGSGIPESARDKIFSPFFTTKKVGKGTGQGLAISRSVIVDKHQGTIRFETAEGKGATFIIRLPLKNDR